MYESVGGGLGSGILVPLRVPSSKAGAEAGRNLKITL